MKKSFKKGKQHSDSDDEDRPNRGVPRFKGDRSKYKDYRTRAFLFYRKCLKKGKPDSDTWLDELVAGLKGAAWDVVEPLLELDLSEDQCNVGSGSSWTRPSSSTRAPRS